LLVAKFLALQKVFFFSLLGSMLPTFGYADIYRYVDKDGVVHFRNKPAAASYSLYLRTTQSNHRKNGFSTTASAPFEHSSERLLRYSEWIHQSAILYQIPEELVRAVISVESNCEPTAVSSAGAQGLMQLMPETAMRMNVKDILDPRENIFGGVRYLRVLANLFNGDLSLTLAAYNAGEGAVFRYGGIPPYAETQEYVAKVLSSYNKYRIQFASLNEAIKLNIF
jgi:soluble lytic murein transglycosylase-like protein